MKNNVLKAVLWVLLVLTAGLYLILNLLDASMLWQELFSATGTLNTTLHAAFTLGCGVSEIDLYSPLMYFIVDHGLTGGLLHRFALTIIPGLLMLVPAAGALLCRIAGWRIPAGVLAGINLLLHLICLYASSGTAMIFALLWLLATAGSVVLLLSCIGVLDGKPLLITFGMLVLFSLTATVVLIFFRLNIGGNLTLATRPVLLKALFGNVDDWPWYASQQWPLSRAAWFLFIGAGAALLCPWKVAEVRPLPPKGQMNPAQPVAPRPAAAQPHPVATPMQSKPGAPDALTVLERLAALYQQGVLTEEEYLRKKAELLERI